MTTENRTQADSAPSPEVLPHSLFRTGIRVTFVGIIVNAILIVLKFIGGFAGSSGALIADAVHSISDFLTDIGVFVGLKFLVKPADRNHPYGHGRLETAVSFFMGLAILLTGLGIMKNACQNIYLATQGHTLKMPGIIALVMGIVSIVSKELLFRYTLAVANRIESNTLRANAWHHRSDALSSVGTVLGVGGAILLGEKWTVLDPLAAVFVSILVMKVGIGIGLKSIRELSDEALSSDRERKIRMAITSVGGVRNYHKVRTRSLGRYATVDVHVRDTGGDK